MISIFKGGVTMTDAVNTIQNMAEATEFELKHTPNVDVATDGNTRHIRATIGLKGIKHPQTEEHYIEWIRILRDGEQVGRGDFTPDQLPIFELQIEGDGQITVQALCNLHGIWEARP
jgi:desulfoferrodoxin-like iron-binding protein